MDTSGHQYSPGYVVATSMVLGGYQLVLVPYGVFWADMGRNNGHINLVVSGGHQWIPVDTSIFWGL